MYSGGLVWESRPSWETMPAHRYQILALDVDGTLLDPDGTLAAPYARGRRSSRPEQEFARCCARAVAIAAPGRSPASSQSTPHSSATRAPSSRSPRPTARSGEPTSTARLSAEVLELFRSRDQPAVVFTDRDPDDADFIIAAYPTGRDGFDDYVSQNREHAEINERWCPRTSPSPRRSRCEPAAA